MTLLPMDRWVAEQRSGHAIMMCNWAGRSIWNTTEVGISSDRHLSHRNDRIGQIHVSTDTWMLRAFSRSRTLHQYDYVFDEVVERLFRCSFQIFLCCFVVWRRHGKHWSSRVRDERSNIAWAMWQRYHGIQCDGQNKIKKKMSENQQRNAPHCCRSMSASTDYTEATQGGSGPTWSRSKVAHYARFDNPPPSHKRFKNCVTICLCVTHPETEPHNLQPQSLAKKRRCNEDTIVSKVRLGDSSKIHSCGYFGPVAYLWSKRILAVWLAWGSYAVQMITTPRNVATRHAIDVRRGQLHNRTKGDPNTTTAPVQHLTLLKLPLPSLEWVSDKYLVSHVGSKSEAGQSFAFTRVVSVRVLWGAPFRWRLQTPPLRRRATGCAAQLRLSPCRRRSDPIQIQR